MKVICPKASGCEEFCEHKIPHNHNVICERNCDDHKDSGCVQTLSELRKEKLNKIDESR